jgi:hypothetical protein
MARSDCGGNGDGGGHCVHDGGDCVNDIVTCRVIRDKNKRGFSGFNEGVYLNSFRYYIQQM